MMINLNEGDCHVGSYQTWRNLIWDSIIITITITTTMGPQKVVEHICASGTAFYSLHTIQFPFYTAVKVAALFSIFERNYVSSILNEVIGTCGYDGVFHSCRRL